MARFEGGPLDGEYRDVEPGADFVQTYGEPGSKPLHYPIEPIELLDRKVYTYVKHRRRHPDRRVEVVYCLRGREPFR